jgi:uncharacterized protein YbjT (DUF2867 family)
MKKIAFFGATGMLGKPVLSEFIRQGYQVSALTRNIEKSMALFPEKVNWIEGDLTQSEKIEETIVGADVVYMNLSVNPESKESDFQPEREGVSAIIKAAKWNNVSRLAYLSSIVKFYEGMNGFQWWAFEIKHESIDKIKRSGIPYIIFNPSSFMENYSEGGFKDGNKILSVGKSKHPNWFIAADDYAKMAIKAIETLDEQEDREYIIQGPECYTFDKAAELYVTNYKEEKLKVTNYPLFLLKFFGIFNRKFNNTSKIVEALNNYPETFASEEVWKELGAPKTTFKEFIQSRKAKTMELEKEVGK